MPIKELKISFSISVEALAAALAASNSGMDIQVLGIAEPPPAPRLNGKAPLALPPPSHGARSLLLEHLKAHPEQTFAVKELIVYAATYGFSPQSVYNALTNMHRDSLVRRYTKGQYRISKGGLAHG